jgi:hypothetical protein
LGGPHEDWSHLDRELEPRVRQLTLVNVHSRENKAYATANGARKVNGWQRLRYFGVQGRTGMPRSRNSCTRVGAAASSSPPAVTRASASPRPFCSHPWPAAVDVAVELPAVERFLRRRVLVAEPPAEPPAELDAAPPTAAELDAMEEVD